MGKLVAGNENTFAFLHGSTPAYTELYKFDMADGQFLSDINVARRDMVVVVGSKVAENLFGDIYSAVGKQVKIQDKRFTITGVMAPRGLSMFGISWDDLAVVPMTTFQTRLFSQKTAGGDDAVQQISVQVADGWTLEEASDQIEATLLRRHRIDNMDDADFSVISPQQLAGTFEMITMSLTVFLGLIGSVSLLVGSIGIMNIMLVSVTERTREIGLRKAIGAKRRDILVQFLLEASVLSLTGGAIGLVFAWLISWGISLVDLGGFTLSPHISPAIVLVAILVSVFIGLASGSYPAVRAARLNPIDALHYG
jgi:putative ABC transport system permease protein